MRGGGSTTTIPHDKDTTALTVGLFQQRQYFLQMWLRDRSHHLLKIAEIRVYRCLCFHCLLPLFSHRLYLWLCVRRYPVWAKGGHVEHDRGSLLIETEVHALQSSVL